MKHPLDIAPKSLNHLFEYQWVGYSVDKNDTYKLDLDSLAISNADKAYIASLLRFKEQIIDNGWLPLKASENPTIINSEHLTNHDQIKYGGLILCNRMKEERADMTTIDQLNQVAATLQQTLGKGVTVRGWLK